MNCAFLTVFSTKTAQKFYERKLCLHVFSLHWLGYVCVARLEKYLNIDRLSFSFVCASHMHTGGGGTCVRCKPTKAGLLRIFITHYIRYGLCYVYSFFFYVYDRNKLGTDHPYSYSVRLNKKNSKY